MLTSIRQPISVFALALGLAAGTAAAQGVRIQVGDLSTPAAASAFDHALAHAAQRLCGYRYAPQDLNGLAVCREAVREEALAQLSPAQQQAYAEARRRSTRLASG